MDTTRPSTTAARSEAPDGHQLIAAGLTDMGGGAPFYDQYVRLENSDG